MKENASAETMKAMERIVAIKRHCPAAMTNSNGRVGTMQCSRGGEDHVRLQANICKNLTPSVPTRSRLLSL